MKTEQRQFEIFFLIFVGFVVSIYLGLFQLHLISRVWDPIFLSRLVLKSSLSQSLPVPDSLLGAFAYFCEGTALALSKNDRLRRGSWMSFLYCFLAVAMAGVSGVLIFYQADILHEGCTLCLLSAVISVSLCVPAARELEGSWLLFRHRTGLGQSRRVALRFFAQPRQAAAIFYPAA